MLPRDNAFRKFETEDHLMAFEDLVPRMTQQMATRDGLDAAEVELQLMKLIQEAAGESAKGSSLIMDWSVTVGRKA